MKQLQPSAVSSPSQPQEESADRAATRASATGRLRRHWRLILVVSMALVVAGWSILWLVAAQTTAGNLGDWVAQEQVLGRNWTCADRRLGGFPFRIEVTCDRPSFQGAVGGADVTGRLGALFAAAEVYAPTSVAVAVEGPLDIAVERSAAPACRMDIAGDRSRLRRRRPRSREPRCGWPAASCRGPAIRRSLDRCAPGRDGFRRRSGAARRRGGL